MARGEMLTIFSYDVTKDKSRRRIARLLERAATRVQFSVFEARMTELKARALGQRLATYLDTGDSLRVYVVGADGLRRSKVYGDGAPFEPEEGGWIL